MSRKIVDTVLNCQKMKVYIYSSTKHKVNNDSIDRSKIKIIIYFNLRVDELFRITNEIDVLFVIIHVRARCSLCVLGYPNDGTSANSHVPGKAPDLPFAPWPPCFDPGEGRISVRRNHRNAG